MLRDAGNRSLYTSPKERVWKAIRHEKTDRLPRGEMIVEEAFLDRLYPDRADAPYAEKMTQLVEEVNLDLVTLKADDQRRFKELGKWILGTSCFVMALIDGLFWRPQDPLSFEEFVLGISQKDERIHELIHLKKKRALSMVRKGLDQGVHGFIIGDDLAFNRGPFISPEDLQKWVFPGLQEIVKAIKTENRVAFLHCCGNVTSLIDLIISTGFDGLHGLATSAGNDYIAIREMTSKRLSLMGIVEVDGLKPREIKVMKEEIAEFMGTGGGYILGSAEGLSSNTPLDSFHALYSPGGHP